MSSPDASSVYRNLSLEQYNRVLIPLVNWFVEEPQLTDEVVKEYLTSLTSKIKNLLKICEEISDDNLMQVKNKEGFLLLSNECVLKCYMAYLCIYSIKCIINRNGIHAFTIISSRKGYQITYILSEQMEKITLELNTDVKELLHPVASTIIEQIKKVFKNKLKEKGWFQ